MQSMLYILFNVALYMRAWIEIDDEDVATVNGDGRRSLYESVD